MKIIIDADACPVNNICIDFAKKYNIEIHLFFDTSHQFESDYAKIHICDKGNDSVDYEILKIIAKDDLVVTQDYGLASLVLSKNAMAINQNGLVYNNNNIDTLLQTRYIGQKMRKAGLRTKGPSKRTIDDDKKFIDALYVILCDFL